MKTKITTLFCLLIALCLTSAAWADDACADALGCVEIAPEESLTIGGILRLSGPKPWSGEVARDAFRLAMLDRGSQLLGREVELILEDSACSAEQAAEAARRMAALPKLLGIIGTNCSLAASGALPIISEAGLFMISPSNSSPRLTDADREAGGLHQPGYFRTAHNDRFVGAISARFAIEILGAQVAATIDDGDPYTQGLARAMAATFSELGGTVALQAEISKGDSDMSGLLGEIAAAGADLVYFPVFADEALAIAQQLPNTPGLEEAVMMSADGAYSTYFAQGAGAGAIGMYMAGPYVSGEAYEAFLQRWRDAIDEAGPWGGFHAHAYDAANLLLDAVEAAAQEREDGSLLIGRGDLRAAMVGVDGYPGLTGSLRCQDESPHAGDCATGQALAIFQLTAAEALEGYWPPAVVWTLDQAADGSDA